MVSPFRLCLDDRLCGGSCDALIATFSCCDCLSVDSIGDVVSDMTDSSNDPETLESWKAKAKQRLSLLHDLNESSKRVKAELVVAQQRVADAEEAEVMVNNGLKTATVRLSERDRQVQELTTANAASRAELATLTEEKKKVDKRLALVKTIGANLQEARDAAATAERRLEEAITANAKLKAANTAANNELAELRPLPEELAARTVAAAELRDELTRARDEAAAKAARAADAEAGVARAEKRADSARAEAEAHAEERSRRQLELQTKRSTAISTCAAVGGLVGGLVLAAICGGGGRRDREDDGGK
jgi:chromosome segregation ATPase